MSDFDETGRFGAARELLWVHLSPNIFNAVYGSFRIDDWKMLTKLPAA